MKTATISKALEEVWVWKKKCYEEAKRMTLSEYLKKTHKDAEYILKRSGFSREKGKIRKITK